MKILLINPPKHDVPPIMDFKSIPYGLLRVGGYLIEQGHDVRLLNCMRPAILTEPIREIKCGNYENEHRTKKLWHIGMSYEEIRDRLTANGKPDEIWVTSTMTYYWRGVHDTIKMCKEVYPDVPVILGGIYASICEEHAKKSGADKIITGVYWPAEGSRTALELLEKIPDYFIIKYTRGCPHNCSFCAVTKLEGHKMHFVDTEQFVQELEEKYHNFGITSFHLWESNLLVDAKNRFEKVLDKLIEKKLPIMLSFPEGLQPSRVYPELARKMKRAGVSKFAIPLESADEDMTDRFHKPSTIKHFDNAIHCFKDAGFLPEQIRIFVLVGMPDQPLKTIIRSDFKVLMMRCELANLFFTPIPGTEEYEKHRHLIADKDLEELHPAAAPFANPEMTCADLEALACIAGMKSIYELVSTSQGPTRGVDNRVIDMLKQEIKNCLTRIDLSSDSKIDTTGIAKENQILDTGDAKLIGEKQKGEVLIGAVDALSESRINYALYRPLPKCMFSRKDRNRVEYKAIPTRCTECLKLLVEGCDVIGVTGKERAKKDILCSAKKKIREAEKKECVECIYFQRGTCIIPCAR